MAQQLAGLGEASVSGAGDCFPHDLVIMCPINPIKDYINKNLENPIKSMLYRFPSPGFKMQKGGLCSLVFGFK
jgi:hypothetical protein